MPDIKTHIKKIKDAGVVGAGGAGFPTDIKINNNAEIIIANGAECEPLLRADRQMMELYSKDIVRGLKIIMDINKAKKGVICLKEKYYLAVEEMKKTISNLGNIKLHLMENYYPAGDEQQMIYEVTNKVVPPGGLPIDVGVIVNNVTTLFNISKALDGIPVTNRYVTVTGDVIRPITINAPIGTPVSKLIEIAGLKESKSKYSIIAGGPTMGNVIEDWDTPVIKTLGGIIVMPKNHRLVQKKIATLDKDLKLAKSVCCQCSYCTDLCPRNHLGLKVEPHKIMRGIGYGLSDVLGDINSIISCCDCRICSYYACPMDLNPNKMMTEIKNALIRKGFKPNKQIKNDVNSFREYRKIPADRFLKRIGLVEYDREAPLEEDELKVSSVRIPLKQHIGNSAKPIVKVNESVKKGQLIAKIENNKLGANIHSSVTGKVTCINNGYIDVSSD